MILFSILIQEVTYDFYLYGKSVRGKPGTSFWESFPGGVTLDACNSPSNECHSSCEMMSTKEAAHYRPSVQGFYWTLITQAACARQIPKFQAARVKAGFSIKHTIGSNSLGAVSHSYQLGGLEPS